MVRIYGLVCPSNGQIRYIGKTTQTVERRLSAHLSEARLSQNSHKQRWLHKFIKIGLLPSIWQLEEVPDGLPWQEREIAWIERAQRDGLSLTNKTKGGDGLHFLSEEDRDKFRESVSREVNSRAPGSNYRKNAGKRAKDSWDRNRDKFMHAFASPETKRKQSERAKRDWSDPETRARLMNRWTPERRAAQAEVIRQRSTPEYRAMMAEKTRQRWANKTPEERAKALQVVRDGKGKGK